MQNWRKLGRMMKLLKHLPTRISKNGRIESWAEFLCEIHGCGRVVERRLCNGLKAKSCGCFKKRTRKLMHGGTHTRLHSVWTDMKQRCNNPNNKSYKNYGGRGITICPEWTNDYISFRDWALNNGYQEGLQINRINNNKNYEPNNCNFVTHKENSRNRRKQKIKNIEMANEIRTLWDTGNYTQKELAEKYNVYGQTIYDIINYRIWS